MVEETLFEFYKQEILVFSNSKKSQKIIMQKICNLKK